MILYLRYARLCSVIASVFVAKCTSNQQETTSSFLFFTVKRPLHLEHCKMVTTVEIKGFDEFAKYTETIATKGPIVLFYFSGSKLPDGNSWCPDCVEAEPVVKAFLTEIKKEVIFVYVDVGDREYWKDRACPFRTDSRTKLMVIPTLIKWKGVQRLEGSQCCNRELLQMLFEEDD